MTLLSKVLVALGGTSEIHVVDAITYEGGLWLVPVWIEQPTERLMKPARIIRVDHMESIPAPPDSGAAMALKKPVPITLFDCSMPPAADSGFEVQDLPPILLNDDGTPSDRGVTVILSEPPPTKQ